MNTLKHDLAQKQSQDDRLSFVDRHLLLKANLRFFLHQLQHGMPVSRAELSSLVLLGDDLEAQP